MLLVAICCHVTTYLAIVCLRHLQLAAISLCDTCGLHTVIAHQYCCALNCHAVLLCIRCCIKHCLTQAYLARPAGVSIGESRQVIQVPGAPPVTIRFGTRPPGPHPPGSHPPPLGQQVLAPHGVCSLDQITCLPCGLGSQCHSILSLHHVLIQCPDCRTQCVQRGHAPMFFASQLLFHSQQTPNHSSPQARLCASHLPYPSVPRGCCSQCHCILDATASIFWQLPICATKLCLH